ncbi:MAG: alpha-2-macroglobulin family protein [Elusimicrobiota bacterium]
MRTASSLLSALLAAVLAAPAAAGLREADANFDKGLYQEALKEYELLSAAAKKETRWRALYRACESEALLFRYGKAVERLRKVELPKAPAWRARFLLLRAEMHREYLKQYGRGQHADVVEDAAEVYRLTPKQLRSEVEQAYWEAWGLRKKLVDQEIEDEKYFVDVEKADRAVYPTFLDFLIHRWSGYLLDEAELPQDQAKPKAISFAGRAYGKKVSLSAHPTALAGAIMEEGWLLKGEPGRRQARELWRLRRLMLGFRHGGRVLPFADREKASLAAAELLKKWMEEFVTPGGRAAAAYEAAELYNGSARFDDAVALCEEAGKRWPDTRGGEKCEKLLAQIRRPDLGLSARIVPPPGDQALTLTSRNLGQVYLRRYKTTPGDLLKTERGVSRRWDSDERWSWSQALNYPSTELIENFLSARQPDKSWTVAVKGKSIYDHASTTADLPDAAPGVYLVVASGDASFEPGASLLYGAIVNVSDIVLVGTTGLEGYDRDLIFRPQEPGAQRILPAFHFYLLNGRSGEAVSEAPLALRHSVGNGRWSDADLATDALGRAQWSVAVQLNPRSPNSYRIDPLAEHRGHWAYWASPSHLGFSVPSQIQLFSETDRPIYRPGQTVRYKFTVTERIPRGYKAYVGTSKVDIRIRDANWQEVHKTAKKVGPDGTLSGEFRIPTGRLLGSYSIQAQIVVAGQTYSASASFAVEEYKRPEFEASLEDAAGAWRFGKEAKVGGKVRYYFGGPVPDAAITYKIQRETYRPWFCWWWSWRAPSGGRQEVLRAATRTDEDGNFSFPFTPQPTDRFAEDSLPARFIVEIEARDSGGRTIKTEKAYLAGSKAYLFKLEPQAGFAARGKAHAVEARLVNLNGEPLAGEGRYTLHRLEGDPEAADPAPIWGGGFPSSPSLEQVYSKVKNGPEAAAGRLWFNKEKADTIQLTGMEPGAYRLTLYAEDPWGGETEQSIIVLAVDPRAQRHPLRIYSLSLPEHQEYRVGETARMLIGSAELDALTHVEIWGGGFLLERRALRGGGIRTLELPLTEQHKGGVTVRWFGVQNFKPRSGALTLRVPWKEKELNVALKYDQVLKPGQQAKWSVTAEDSQRRKVRGEATVRMFDRSLEYYAKEISAPIESLYAARPRPSSARGSLHALSSTHIRIVRGVIKKIFELFQKRIEEPLAPALRLNRSRVGRWDMMFQTKGLAMERGGRLDASEMMADKMMPASAPMGGMAKKSMRRSEAAAAEPLDPPAPEVQVRKDFSETAVFAPHLKLRAGVGEFSFKAPERLTSWRVSGHVITSDVKFGRFSQEAVTKKELMVRVETPRFFREGDRGTLKAIVHNETDSIMSGEVTIAVSRDGRPAASELGLKTLGRRFAVKPHGLQAFSWKIEVPGGIATYKVQTIARAGERVDAEERELPIFPSRQRLIESLVVALNGDVKKTLELKSLIEKDPSRISELLQLQVDPQLILTVMNSLPFLVSYPYECVEQTLNRYVPLAVVHALYGKHPALAQAAAKLPKRQTITPAWEKDDPKRMTQLMETPWVQASQGRESFWPIIDLFNAKTVARQKKDALEKLKAAQLPGGGFPWFPGGRADPYITLLVLAGFSEAQHYGVPVPEDVVRQALNYLMNEIPLHLKPEERDVALLLYASYVVTSFPEALGKTDIREFGRARQMAKAWLDYADKHYQAMTQLGKAYAAYAYWRLGDKQKGDLYLKRAMDGAREDETAGVYWQPEKNSWLWYNDTLETHAFITRALQTLRPKDKRIPGLIQWMIFNRKGTEWKSTKASAAAIFTLLDFMKRRGALDKGDSYAVDWGGVKDSVQVEPYDWLAKPLRWTKRGADITPAEARPRVDKKGPGLAFASVTHIYSTEKLAEASKEGMLNVRRKFYRRVKQGEDYHLKPLKRGDTVRVGDEIEVRLTINTRSQFEYVHIKDPRGAGFEAEELRSGWKWDRLGRYEEPRDSLTNFFVSWLPHGEYVLRYRVRPTTPGEYRIGAAVMQSMYAPEFAAHSSGFTLKVEEAP